jgi:NAD(P)-dependent dehydrogenase (short-subunit alcohol dehydrogenase family)
MADSEMDELGERLTTDREGAYATCLEDVPLRRAATAAEVAGTIAWLLSSDAAYISGAVLPVDGGHTTVDVATIAFGKLSG